MNRFRSNRALLAAIGVLGSAPVVNVAAQCTVETPPADAAVQAERLRVAGDRQAAVLCYEIASRTGLSEAALRSTRDGLARLYEELGEYDKAHQQLSALLDQRNSDPAATADLLRRIGWIEYRRGAYPRAEQHLREAALLAREAHGAASVELARILNSLGAVLRDVADYEDAQQTLESALHMAGENTDLSAVINNNLGGLWYYRGDYRKAVEHYRSALVAFERLQGASGADVASALSNLGLMYQELGALREALPFMQRALLIKEKLYGPVHASVGSTVNNLARLHAQLGNDAMAEVGFQRALTIYERTLGPDHPNVAHVLHLFGMFRESRGDAAAARVYFERSLAIREQTYGADSNWTAETLVSLGPALASGSEQIRAEEVMIRALALAVMSAEDELLWTAFASYARVLARDQALAAAVFYGKHAVNIVQRMRSDIAALGQPLQHSFLLDRSAIYRDLVDWLITLGRLADAEQVMAMLKDEEYFDYVRDTLRGDDSGVTRAGFPAAEQVDV
ncbi:MAG: tetratricopeptide repeat protein, partial [Steroidobacter sp.]